MTPRLSPRSYFGLGQVPIGIGAQLWGWDITKNEVKQGWLCSVDFRAMTEKCPHNCYHCFTDKQRKTLSLEEIKGVIDQIGALDARGINYLGEGEPTIDPDFFKIVRYTSEKGLVPIVFTDAATKLRDRSFVRELYESGATILPKCDSLFNEGYQNWVVGDKSGKYFSERNQAIEMLIEERFSRKRGDGTTQLGFDMVVTKSNIHEVEKTLRYCRNNNLWIAFSWYLPSGRCSKEGFDLSLAVSEDEKTAVREVIGRVDREYGFNHRIFNNFGTHPCTEFMQVYGDGRVSPCAGSDEIFGNVRTESLAAIGDKILSKYPCHNLQTSDGSCVYRPKVPLVQIGERK